MNILHEIQVDEAWGLRVALEPHTNAERLTAYEAKRDLARLWTNAPIRSRVPPLFTAARIAPANVIQLKGADNGRIERRELS